MCRDQLLSAICLSAKIRTEFPGNSLLLNQAIPPEIPAGVTSPSAEFVFNGSRLLPGGERLQQTLTHLNRPRCSRWRVPRPLPSRLPRWRPTWQAATRASLPVPRRATAGDASSSSTPQLDALPLRFAVKRRSRSFQTSSITARSTCLSARHLHALPSTLKSRPAREMGLGLFRRRVLDAGHQSACWRMRFFHGR